MRLIKYGISLCLSMLFFYVGAQKPSNKAIIENKAFDRTVSNLLDFSVPIIGVQELDEHFDEYVLLDARERQEFEVSHIQDAKFVGFDNWDESVMKNIPKDQAIVVYCSVGYRSEKIGEKLENLGYTNVQNLYGSIFEWVNQNKPVYDMEGNPTQKVHGYSWLWGRWVKNEAYEKVY